MSLGSLVSTTGSATELANATRTASTAEIVEARPVRVRSRPAARAIRSTWSGVPAHPGASRRILTGLLCCLARRREGIQSLETAPVRLDGVHRRRPGPDATEDDQEQGDRHGDRRYEQHVHDRPRIKMDFAQRRQPDATSATAPAHYLRRPHSDRRNAPLSLPNPPTQGLPTHSASPSENSWCFQIG